MKREPEHLVSDIQRCLFEIVGDKADAACEKAWQESDDHLVDVNEMIGLTPSEQTVAEA